MPRNGSGLYFPPPANYPAVSATLITAADRNAIDADLATALTNSLAVNGESVVTADIPFGNNKLTGVKDGTSAKDAANVSQIQNSNAILLATVAGTDTITASLSPALTAYANGQIFTLIPANTNTGAVTININGLGAKALTKNGSTALVAGDLVAGVEYSLQYDGTRFQKVAGSDYLAISGGSLTGLLNVNDGADIASATTVDLTAATGNTVRITGTTPITEFTMNAGQQMELVAVGALPLTYHATTMNINGGANYTCSANDRLRVFKDGAGVIQVNVTKQAGDAIADLASQAEAEAGSENTKMMTSLRTKQSIDANKMTLNTEQTATGALMQFTGIPSTAKRVTVIFNGVSVSGTSNVKFQLGTTVALETTGYASTVTSGAGGASTSSSTSGHMATGQIISAHAYSGHVVFTKVSGNTWVGSGTLLSSGTLAYSISASTKTLSGALTRIGLLCDNGSDTFDSGTFNAIYE